MDKLADPQNTGYKKQMAAAFNNSFKLSVAQGYSLIIREI